MSYIFQEHDGLITVILDGKLPEPFMYINARSAPPWLVEPISGKSLAFESLEAAKAALILNMEERHGTHLDYPK
jgi:hypothetical protein